MIALLVFTDGRDDLLARTIGSAEYYLADGSDCPIVYRFIFDDTGDPHHRVRLFELYGERYSVLGREQRLGFRQAIATAWSYVPLSASYVFHLEDDFTFNRTVPLSAMARLLSERPYLAQVALRRQPWGDEPLGGFMAQRPELYVQRDGWIETTRNFTTNPCLYRRELIDVGWPDVPRSEEAFTDKLKRQGLPWGVPGEAVRFGFYGDPNNCTHIGVHRVGTGY